MKEILMSIKPQWVEKILNGEKTIEIRKRFPKDFAGWVYIYCTKAKPYICKDDDGIIYEWKEKTDDMLNGKIVARFWCDKVDESDKIRDFLNGSCLEPQDVSDYLKGQKGYAIHIDYLYVFEKPKELKGKAPQSWRYKTFKEEVEW